MEHFPRGSVVEEGNVLVGVGLSKVRVDVPAERNILVDYGLGELLERRRAVDQEEAPVGGCCDLDGLQVGKGNITDVNATAVPGANFLRLILHQFNHPVT